MVKNCVALRISDPLSATTTVKKLVVPACATAGRHVKTPLDAPSDAFESVVSRLKVRKPGAVCASVAVLVNCTVTPPPARAGWTDQAEFHYSFVMQMRFDSARRRAKFCSRQIASPRKRCAFIRLSVA